MSFCTKKLLTIQANVLQSATSHSYLVMFLNSKDDSKQILIIGSQKCKDSSECFVLWEFNLCFEKTVFYFSHYKLSLMLWILAIIETNGKKVYLI